MPALAQPRPPIGQCPSCGTISTLHPLTGRCRLCRRRDRARRRWEAGDTRDTRRAEAVYGGQQLFLDGMEHKLALAMKGSRHRSRLRPTQPRSTTPPRPGPIRPLPYRQLVLFDATRELVRDGRYVELPPPPVSRLAEALEAAAIEYGPRHGWTDSLIGTARRGLRVLLALQDTPGAPIRASEAAVLSQLSRRALTVTPVLAVLASVGMLDDDRVPAIVPWFNQCASGLPHRMARELTEWFTAMREGSSRAPRLHVRTDRTVRNHLTVALPFLKTWAAAGHDSLREITKDQVYAAAARARRPGQRKDIISAFRSIFRLLKARGLVFANPTTGLRGATIRGQTPLPLTVDELVTALDPAEPTRAALAALLIFHGIRPRQLRSLHLLDHRDGRLHVDGLVILLAPAVLQRLTTYLDFRCRRWPATANPHLFINVRTASRTSQATYVWVNKTLGIPASRFREDRILDEIHASGGDVRRAAELFGLTIPPLMRYLATLNHRGLGG
ncbi:site-specific integrase [Couchioplanes caeruleus]|uniref:Core-binding (CB) domain-containing protein n=1 Tax=Couchioplanes caeruleus TaxID=56438 RepID=A0A3N1GT88_9ACTN|nr:hypothetical protein [Couchioplanes caeruleus]ROP33470.1 hypothetical protein EDD30_6455 [Couchioplanes caeruleus]